MKVIVIPVGIACTSATRMLQGMGVQLVEAMKRVMWMSNGNE